uniref:GRIP domain-containing protein n=1 Tax=Strigamia maritima TaxID=126957 RepID=T1J702_STRMM
MSLNEMSLSSPNESPREEGKSAASFLENATRDDLIKQIKKYVGLLQKTKAKCDEMKAKNRNLEQEMTKFKENFERKQELDNEVDGTIRKYNQAKEEMECMKLKEDTLKTTIHSLQNEISQLTNENTNLRSYKTELDILNEEKLKILNDNTVLKTEIEELNSTLRQNNEENNSIKTEFANLKKTFDSEIEAKIEAVNILIADKTRLETELSKLLEEKNELKDSLEDLTENQTKYDDLEEVLLQLEQVQNDNVVLRAELENASVERDRLLFQEQREESCSVLDQIQKLESELDDYKNKLEGAEFEVDELKSKLEELNETEDDKLELENLKTRENLLMEFLHECLDSEKHQYGFENKLNLVKTKFSDLQNEIEKLSFQLEDKNVEILELREKYSNIDAFKDENEKLKSELSLLHNNFNKFKDEEFFVRKIETSELKMEIELTKKLLVENEENIAANEIKFQDLVEKNSNLKTELQNKEKSSEWEKSSLEKEIECLKSDLEIKSGMTNEMLDSQSKIRELLDENAKLKMELGDKESSFGAEKSELEKETDYVKKDLKLKCEIISQQGSRAEEMSKEIEGLQSKLGDLVDENSNLTSELLNKVEKFESERSQLEKEIVYLKNNRQIISQQEDVLNIGMEDMKNEMSRLRTKLDDLLEENSKLTTELDSKERTFETECLELEKKIESAQEDLKIKDDMISQHQIILNGREEVLKQEVLDLQTKLRELEEKNECLLQRPSLDEFNKMEQSYKETIDEEKQIALSFKTEMDKTLMDLALARAQLVDLKADVDLKKSDTNATKAIINEVNAKVSVLTYEKDKLQTKNDELTMEMKRLTDSMNSISKQLVQEKESHAKTTSQFELAQTQMKQQKLDNLEFADYERVVGDLNQQIKKSNDVIEKLNREMKQRDEMFEGLNTQLDQVEKQRKQNEERCAKMKILLVKSKKELAELTKSNSERNEVEIQMKGEVEMCKHTMESMQVELSQVMGTNVKLEETIAVMSESRRRVVDALESRVSALQEDLEISRQEYKECKADFDNYKVRVHSVLKQQKEKSSAVVQQEIDACEKEYLEKALSQLRLKLEEVNEQVTALKTEKGTLQDEYDRVVNRHERALDELQKNEKELNEKLENMYTEEAVLKRKHGEALQQLRFQNEVIVETYKEQIRTLREEKDRMVSDLQVKLVSAESEVTRSHQKVLNRDENEVFDIASTERQEGEGSENTEHGASTPVQYTYDNLATEFSLEQLLNAKTSVVSTNGSHDEFESVEQRLLSSSKKIDHLTELLNESEATNLRLSEQTKVLKEEIRRLERNQEREKHAANMEYLKNIVLKFLTLSGGDERERLVPVLTMMLKLSPEERNGLTVIAKGDNLETDGDNAGWSNYLPRWSGLV